MNTVEELRKLSEKAILLKEKGLLSTLKERATERELIEPFIEALGYDLGLLAGEVETQPKDPLATTTVKCDYAIKKDDARIVLIEAKGANVSLGTPDQLSTYFRQVKSSEVWLGIFTNGTEYRFNSGYIQENIKRMDSEPFLVLNLLELEFDEAIAETVSTFAKDRFDPKEVRTLAKERKLELARERKFQQKYEPAIHDALREELEEPSEELCKLLINKIDAEDEEFDQLKPLVKKAANQILKLPPPPGNGDDTSPTTERELFLTAKYGGVNAKGYYNPQKFVVLKGSEASRTETPTLHKYASLVAKKRKELLQSGVLKDNGRTFVFTQDYAFNSPSLASSVCLGRNSTGWTEWTDKNGLPLRELVKKW